MIKHRGYFTKNEFTFIELLDECMIKLFHADGLVMKAEKDVRYEVNIGSCDNKAPFVLQFCVRDHEDLASGFSNFVLVSNIRVPREYRRRGVATRIIFMMSYVATREVGIDLYVTCITNDYWRERLISAGSIVDADGDIQIYYEPFLEYFKDKLMYPNYLT